MSEMPTPAIDLSPVDPFEWDDASEPGVVGFWSHAYRSATVWIGVVVVLLVAAGSLLAEPLSPYAFDQLSSDAMAGVSGNHWLGTDNLGRDLLTRSLVGARSSLTVALTSVTFAALFGVVLGATAGFKGGRYDLWASRILDTIFALPPILMALTVIAILGAGQLNLIVALVVILTPYFGRVARAPAIEIREREFCAAAQVSGLPDRAIIRQHVIPNLMPTVLVQMASTASLVIIIEASLSYLGLGVQPPKPAWGRMIFDAQRYMELQPMMVVAPAIFIVLVSIGLNLLADGLQHATDPRTRNRQGLTIKRKGENHMRSRSRPRLWLTLGLALAVFIAGCSSEGGGETTSPGSDTTPATTAAPTTDPGGGTTTSAPATGPVDGGTIVYGQDQEPFDGLDPNKATSFPSIQLRFLVYEGLVTRDDSFSIQPALATSWEEVEPNVWEFTLREGVTFHRGGTFDADDVIYSLDRVFNPDIGARAASRVKYIESYEKTGDFKVRITLSTSYAGFLDAMAWDEFVPILDKEWTEGQDSLDADMNGTGPFQLVEWVQGDHLTVARFADYWDGAPHLDQVVFQLLPDEATRLAALRTGDIQMGWFRDPGLVQRAVDDGFQTGTPAYTRRMLIMLDLTSGTPIADVNVRRAISTAIDREQLLSLGHGGLGQMTVFFPPDDPLALQAGTQVPYLSRDLDAARQHLSDAGYPDGVTVTMTLASDPSFAIDVPFAEALKAQLAEAGINLELNFIPFVEILGVFGGNYPSEMVLVPGIMQPTADLYVSDFAIGPPVNKIQDEALSGQILAARTETDPAARAQAYADIQMTMAEQVYALVPYAVGQRYEVWSPQIQGYSIDPTTGRVHLKDAWISEG